MTELKLTDRAKAVMDKAESLARQYDTSMLGTQHVLMGILSETECIGFHALKNLSVDIPVLWRKLWDGLKLFESTWKTALKTPPSSSYFDSMMAQAKGDAKRLQCNYIGTEHLLLGILCNEGTAAAHMLNMMGVYHGDVWGEVKKLLGLDRKPEPVQPAAPTAFEYKYSPQIHTTGYLTPKVFTKIPGHFTGSITAPQEYHPISNECSVIGTPSSATEIDLYRAAELRRLKLKIERIALENEVLKRNLALAEVLGAATEKKQ